MPITKAQLSIISESANEIVVGIDSYDSNSPRHDMWRKEGHSGSARNEGIRVGKDINPNEYFYDNSVEPNKNYRYELSSHSLPLTAPQGHESGVNILVDTDMHNDCDDGGALHMLHNLHRRGECGIACVVANPRSFWPAGAVEAQLVHLGYDTINEVPVGSYKGNNVGREQPDNEHYVDIRNDTSEYGHTRTDRIQDFPDAVDIIRQTLVNLPSDATNVYASIGFLSNIKEFLESGPDSISPLTGIELAQQKLSRWEIMGGDYPTGDEHNFSSHGADFYTQDAINLVNQTGLPVYFTGFSLGRDVRSGTKILDLHNQGLIPATDPLYRAYLEVVGGNFRHYSYDHNTVIGAVRGLSTYFDLVQGEITVSSNGSNTWTNDSNGPHFYATIGSQWSESDLEDLYDDLMTEHFEE